MGEQEKKEEQPKVEVKQEEKKEETPKEKKVEEKKEEKQEEEKKEEPKPPSPRVLFVDLHCVGCAKKIQRTIMKMRGVEGVVIDMAKNEVTIKGIVEPQTICNTIIKKTKRRASVISPLPPAEGEPIPEVVNSQVSGPETVELNVNMHCEACAEQLKRKILQMRVYFEVALRGLKLVGRSKNVWESPLGCLMFSFTLQMEDGRVVPLVQYVVSLAITEAIKDICDKNGLPCIDVKIKWPNDLYLNGFKVGGILCTSTYKSKKFNISAGIGLNVNNEKPTTSLNSVLRELSVGAYQFQREDVLAAFFNKFEKFFDLFVNQGFQTLEELYYKTWLHSGQRVVVQEKNEDKVIEHVVTIQGLTSSGYLLAVGDDNQMCELHPDGNSFDFLKGLVRRKLE